MALKIENYSDLVEWGIEVQQKVFLPKRQIHTALAVRNLSKQNPYLFSGFQVHDLAAI